MQSVSMLEFRQNAAEIVEKIRAGQRMLLTYRGQPVARLEPVQEPTAANDDPFYALDELADQGGRSLSNEQIDRIVYGS